MKRKGERKRKQMNNFTNEYQKGIAKQANDELFNNIIVEYGEPEEIRM